MHTRMSSARSHHTLRVLLMLIGVFVLPFVPPWSSYAFAPSGHDTLIPRSQYGHWDRAISTATESGSPYPDRYIRTLIKPIDPADAFSLGACSLPIADDDWRSATLAESSRRTEPSATLLPTVFSLATELGLDPTLVLALIQAESNFAPTAISTAGAVGLMQLMPDQGARHAHRLLTGEDRSVAPHELRDPANNLRLGMTYLRYLDDHYRGIGDPDLRRATVIAAYNAGPGRLDALIRLSYQSGYRWSQAQLLRRVPHETQIYVPRVLRFMANWQRVNQAVGKASSIPG